MQAVLMLSLAVCAPCLAAPQRELNIDLALDVIAEVENSHGRIGTKGEVTPWQLLPAVWYSYTKVSPFVATPEHKRWVAGRHAKAVMAALLRLHLPPTAYNFGLVWNAGEACVASGKIPAAKLDYAQRTQNLYEAYLLRAIRKM